MRWFFDYQFCMGLVEISGRFLKYVKIVPQPREMVLCAIKNSGSIYVEDCYNAIEDKSILTPEVIGLNLNFLKMLSEQPPELCLEWCLRDSDNLALVHIHTPELVIRTLEVWGSNGFKSSKIQDEAICELAVSKSPGNIKHVWEEYSTYKLACLALDLSDGWALCDIRNPTREIYRYCMEKGWNFPIENCRYDLFDQDLADYCFSCSNRQALYIPQHLHSVKMIRWLTRNKHFYHIHPDLKHRQKCIYYFLRQDVKKIKKSGGRNKPENLLRLGDAEIAIDFDFLYETLFMFSKLPFSANSFCDVENFAATLFKSYDELLKSEPDKYIKFYSTLFYRFNYNAKVWIDALVDVAATNGSILSTLKSWRTLSECDIERLVKSALANDGLAVKHIPQEHCNGERCRMAILQNLRAVEIVFEKLAADSKHVYENVMRPETCERVLASGDFTIFRFLPWSALSLDVWGKDQKKKNV